MVERMVLESLAGTEKTKLDIVHDTHLDPGVVENILSSFLEREYVIFANNLYALNKKYVETWQAQLIQTEERREEVRELLSSLANEYFHSLGFANSFTRISPVTLKIRKVWADESEALMLMAMLQKLEQFVKELEGKNKKTFKDRPIAQKQVIVWGQAGYGSLALQSLDVI